MHNLTENVAVCHALMQVVYNQLYREALDTQLSSENVSREFHNCADVLITINDPRDAVARRKIETSLVRARKAHEEHATAHGRRDTAAEVMNLVPSNTLDLLSWFADREPINNAEAALRILFLEGDFVALARAAIMDSDESFPSAADRSMQMAWAIFGPHHRHVFSLLAAELRRTGVEKTEAFHLSDDLQNRWSTLSPDRIADACRGI